MRHCSQKRAGRVRRNCLNIAISLTTPQNKTSQTLMSHGTPVEQPSPEVCSTKRITAIRELENGTLGERMARKVTTRSSPSLVEVLSANASAPSFA